MIIKFDHISYSCKTEESVEWLVGNYIQEFKETHLPNIEAKCAFLQKYEPFHDIALYNCHGKYPIEVTAYPECMGENKKFDISDEVITVYSMCPEKTVAFYEAVGFRLSEGMFLELLPFMEQKKVILQVVQADIGEVFLDKKGFGSLAFVVDRIEKHKQQLEKKGYAVSSTDPLSVNGKELKICFVSDDAGDIVELIGVR